MKMIFTKKKDDQEQVHTIKTSYNQEVDGYE